MSLPLRIGGGSPVTLDLFGNERPPPRTEPLAEGAVVLRAFARELAPEIIAAIKAIEKAAPFRHMITPGGFPMSVAMTNCGRVGWITDETGYRYEPGARMSLHQDRNERDFTAPIVSVSLGLPATFLFGGLKRGDRPRRTPLENGDVVVWGGESRLFFHGVAPLAEGEHPLTGSNRFNITFRKAL